MAFAWQTRYYPTRLEYQAALLPFAVPSWIKKVTIHHTYKPTQADWRGRRTMDVLERYYRAKGWPSGPHLFLAPDGIWAGTPLANPGTHAGVCNRDAIGLEIVGDFDGRPWDLGLRERVYMLLVVLLQWAGLTEAQVRGHRECNSPKSCPGTAIGMDIVRSDVRQRLFDRYFTVAVPAANVRLYPRTNSLIIGKASQNRSLPAHPVRGELYAGSDRWARVRLTDQTIGHIYAGLGNWSAV